MMNLKYYLRGLGIGVIVTALIMGIATGGKEKLSNAEIRERAKALGMVEEGTLLENASQTPLKEAEKEQEGLETITQEPDAVKEPDEDTEEMKELAEEEMAESGEPDTKPEDPDIKPEEPDIKPEEPDTKPEEPDQTADEPAKVVETPNEMAEEDPADPVMDEVEETQKEAPPATGSVSIRIVQGDGSYSACKRLEEAGLIESASEFDLFLYQNGYDKKIRAGTFEIPANADGEKIARIITGLE